MSVRVWMLRSTVSELCHLPTQSAVLAGGLDFNRVHLCRASYLGVGGSSGNPKVWRADGDDCDVDGVLELRAECIVHNHPDCATDVDQHRAVWRRKLRLRGLSFGWLPVLFSVAWHATLLHVLAVGCSG